MDYRRPIVRVLLTSAVFTGSFLSFLIQPIAGKILTPQYGGSALVWCICILFFQVALLCGYGLAAFLSSLKRRFQFSLTIALFGLGILAVRIPPPGPEWIPVNLHNPGISLIAMMAGYLMLPCVMLSTVSVLVQNWFYQLKPSPYQLYAVSNAGSVIALVMYPFVIEPSITLTTTLKVWDWLFGALSLTMSLTAILLFRSFALYGPDKDGRTEKVVAPKVSDYGRWLLQSLAGAALLVSTTAMATTNIAPIPLLWIAVLVVYLLTFILCFSHRRYYDRKRYTIAAQILLSINVFLPVRFMDTFPLLGILNALALLFTLCMTCHGELTRNKPHPQFLPQYYLAIAFGGVLGSAGVNFVAPLVFREPIEHALVVSSIACWTVYLMVRSSVVIFRPLSIRYGYALVALPLFGIPVINSLRSTDSVVHVERNFYNTASVVRNNRANALGLYSGTTIHGFQLTDPEKSQMPTAYYSPDSAVGILNSYIRRINNRPMKIASVGLGIGTIAAYGEPGDTVVFYEIDPKIRSIAQRYFTFLRYSRARVDIRMGDARQTLSCESPGQYDLLILDAFNGGSIPYHLLTREAMKVYMSHLGENGVIAFHVTNHYLDLASVVNNVALSLNLQSAVVQTRKGPNQFGAESRYIVVSRAKSLFAASRLSQFAIMHPNVTIGRINSNPQIGVWTDDFINVVDAMDIL